LLAASLVLLSALMVHGAFAADPIRRRELSDRFLGTSRLYPGWQAFNRTVVLSGR